MTDFDGFNSTWKGVIGKGFHTEVNNSTIIADPLNTAARVSLCAYYVFVIVASIIGNTTLIAVIAKLKELHTLSHLFIVNLAICNLITSVIYVPFDIDELVRNEFVHGKALCAIYKLTFMLSLPMSMINLCLLTLETFLTILFPYKKSRIVNKKSATICLLIGYIYAVVFTTFPVLRNPSGSILILDGNTCIVDTSVEYIYAFAAMNLFVPLSIIITLNIWIYCIANGQTKKIRRSSFRVKDGLQQKESIVPLPTFTLPSNSTSMEASSSANIKQSLSSADSARLSFIWPKEGNGSFACNVRGKTAFVINTKAAKRIGMLVGECLFCWLIYDIIVLRNIAGYYSPVLTRIGAVINYSSLFLNPLVYGMYNPRIKRTVIKTFRHYLNNVRGNHTDHNTTGFIDRDSFIRFIVDSKMGYL